MYSYDSSYVGTSVTSVSPFTIPTSRCRCLATAEVEFEVALKYFIFFRLRMKQLHLHCAIIDILQLIKTKYSEWPQSISAHPMDSFYCTCTYG